MTRAELQRKVLEVRPTVVDRAISYFSPVRGVQRHRARMALAMVGGYTGARRDRRATSEWPVSVGSADADILPDLPTLRDRSGDLERNEPLAGGAISTVVTHAIGTGLWPRPQIDRELLGLTEEAAHAWEKQAEREFWLWADSYECDITRTQKFCALQALALRSRLGRGDVFVARYFLERPGSPYGLKIGFIEGDRVANPPGVRDGGKAPNGNRICGGIEIDAYGAPVANHILKQHPGDFLLGTGAGSRETERREVFGTETGERLILHLFARRRVDQKRGVPFLAPVIEPLKQLGRYKSAEIDATVVSSFLTLLVKTASGEGMAPMTPTSEIGGKKSDQDFKLGPAAVLDLLPNEDVTVVNPLRPNPNFEPFVQAFFRQIGVGLEIPFEVLMKYFQSSYSAARGALLEAWKMFSCERGGMADDLCQPVYEWVISEAVARGRLASRGFFDDPLIRAAWLGTQWIGPPPGMIDPEAEANAAEKWIDLGVKTMEEVTTETTGGDWETKHAQRAKERRMRVEAGLDVEAIAQRTQVETPGPAAPPKPSPTQAEKQRQQSGGGY
jgi:lambda family phage portal protein